MDSERAECCSLGLRRVHCGHDGLCCEMHHANFIYCLGRKFFQHAYGLFVSAHGLSPQHRTVRHFLEYVVNALHEGNLPA